MTATVSSEATSVSRIPTRVRQTSRRTFGGHAETTGDSLSGDPEPRASRPSFGNPAVRRRRLTRGFASLLHDRFALIVKGSPRLMEIGDARGRPTVPAGDDAPDSRFDGDLAGRAFRDESDPGG